MRSCKVHYFITGLIMIALGVLTLRYPLEAIMTAGFFIGIGLIASGLNYFSAFYFFGLKRFILLGLLDFLMGLYMTVQPGVTAFVIPFMAALWLACTGFSRVGVSLWLGGAKVRGWWLVLLDGIILIMLAGLMGASPLSSALSVMVIMSCVLIVSGVLAVLEGIMLS